MKFLFLFILFLSGCATIEDSDKTPLATEELKVSPEALSPCEKLQPLEEQELDEEDTLRLIGKLLDLNDKCSDKQQVLANVIKSVNIKQDDKK